MVSSLHLEPVSRTDQYKRVMKPLLERKRRARINRCLDELRDLLVSAMQAEGETVTRLEKADILELTVRHVRRLSQRRRLIINPADRTQDSAKYQQGFMAAAQQVQSFLLSSPSLVEPSASSRLLVHLSTCASSISKPQSQPQLTTPSLLDLTTKNSKFAPITQIKTEPVSYAIRQPSPAEPRDLSVKRSQEQDTWRPW